MTPAYPLVAYLVYIPIIVVLALPGAVGITICYGSSRKNRYWIGFTVAYLLAMYLFLSIITRVIG